jgi:hypothetical protein
MRYSDEEFIELWQTHQSASAVAKILDVDLRNLHRRRKSVESRYGIQLVAEHRNAPQVTLPANGVRVNVEMDNGMIIVFSDAHYWPGIVSTAHRALVTAVKELKPHMVIANGDCFDGAAPGRHGRIQWEGKPNVKQELEAVTDRLAEVEAVAGNAKLHWTWGNHDARFNTKLSAMVPEFEGVAGFNLADHFPRWKFSTSVMVNENTMIKHRWHNGIHCSYNNVLKSGVSMVCGHTHSLKVTPYSDYSPQTRYGVDTGTLACPVGEQFTYSEDSPANHRSGFAVLTYRNGQLLPPELLEVISEEDGLICFRGQVVQV